MTQAAGGFFQSMSNGWNYATQQASIAYIGMCNLTNRGWQKLMEFDAVQKTVNFASPHFNTAKEFCYNHYPNSLKFQWSRGTCVSTLLVVVVAGEILRALQTERSKIEAQIANLDRLKNQRPLTPEETNLEAALKAHLNTLN